MPDLARLLGALLALLAAVLLCPEKAAHAGLEAMPQVCKGKHCDCMLRSGRARCELQVHPSERTFVTLPALITDLNHPERGKFKLGQFGDTLIIEAQPGIAATAELPLLVEAGTMARASLTIRIAAAAHDANRHVHVTEKSDLNAATEDALKVQQARRYLDEPEHEMRAVVRNPVPPLPGEAYIEFERGKPDGQDWLVRFTMHNPGALAVHLKEVWHVPSGRNKVLLDSVVTSEPAQIDGVLVTVEPGQNVRGVARIPQVTDDDIRLMKLSFVSDAGKLLSANQGIEFFPLTDREQENRQRDAEAEGRITLLFHALLGAIWLANPLDKEELDAARLTGVALGARYGFNRYLAFGGDVSMAWSKQARFAENTPGELTRDAILGRVSAGLVLQFGREITPIFQAGVGLQGLRHNADYVSMPGGPDTDFELEAFWYFGGGVEVPLSGGLRLGVDLSVFGEALKMASDGTSAVLQLGAYAAYSWKP